MSHRLEKKQAARAARLAAEAAAERRERLRRLTILAVVVALASAAVAIAIVASSSGDDAGPATPAEASALFAGIPQDGVTLGDPDAPVALEEFADLQCPFCAQHAQEVLPTLIDEYVRSGQVRLVYRNLAFLGPDSETGATFVAAAAAQDKLWPVVERFYANQGAENSGYVTDAFLDDIAAGVPGLDRDRLEGDRDGAAVDRQLAEARDRASAMAVDSTPSFVVTDRAGREQKLAATDLDSMRAALDAALAVK